MRCVKLALGLWCFLLLAAPRAEAMVNISVNLSTQTMTVTSSDGAQYEWPVSTARPGYVTPRGSFRPQRMYVMVYSRKYDNAPMPHSIFFTGGYAIHGSYEVGHLGRPASHGCIRLAPANAALLFAMVKREGARINIYGAPPYSPVYAALSHHKSKHIVVAHHNYRSKATTALAYGAPQPHHAPALQLWLADPVGWASMSPNR